jgi:hypothetical protein
MALTLDGTNGIVSSGSITTQSATGVIFSDSSSLPAASSPYVLKNRIINGDMVIAQRGSSFSNPTAGFYTLDRWYIRTQNASIVSTITQSSTAPAGFTNSFYLSIGTGASSGSTDRAQLYQGIEGFNVADLGWGTASAKTITISFWVRSSLTGQFGGSLQNNDGNRSYPFIYTISSANTWEQKSVTIAGDTTGTWTTNSTAGIQLFFDLGAGSSFLTTASSWASGDYRGATGDTSIVATTGATFYITGVQLEQNTSATPFERRLYNQELANCQRYYYQITGGSTNTFAAVGIAVAASSTVATPCTALPVAMRSAPTISFGGTITVDAGPSNVATFTSLSSSYGGTAMCWFAVNVTGNALTVGRAANVYTNNATTNYVAYSAEL